MSVKSKRREELGSFSEILLCMRSTTVSCEEFLGFSSRLENWTFHAERLKGLAGFEWQKG